MRTGSINGTIYGNEWQTIYDSGELGSAQTSITISNLDGNTDKEYRLICRFVSNVSAGVGSYQVKPNNDTGNNYGYQQVYGVASSAGAERYGVNISYLGYSDSTGDVCLSDTLFYAKSGFPRTFITTFAGGISGTTVTRVHSLGEVWNNTSDNITSLVIQGNVADSIGIGSRIILMRRADRDASTIGKTGDADVYGRIKGCFQKIYENYITANSTSFTIGGLDGNTDILYKCVVRMIDASGIGGGTNCTLRYNGDSGNNYGYQHVTGYYSTAIAGRTTWTGDIICQTNITTGAFYTIGEKLIFAKSGYVRTSLGKIAGEVVNSDVNYSMDMGASWNNAVDNITSIVVSADRINGLGTGTVIELWAYRP